MLEFLIHNMAPIIFLSMALFLLLGYPITFALAANGLVFGTIGIQLGLLSPALFGALPERIFGVMSNDTLLAIPFFTFMGLILERSGMAEDLLDTIGQLFGPVRGGLAYAVIFVGALLAATTGIVAASVISMGLIALPIMLRYGYDRRMASGVIAASGTLAQAIPPSLVLIIMADQLGRSVGDMYKGAFVPAFVLTGLYAAWILVNTIWRPQSAPALPPEARSFREPNGKSGAASLLVLTAVAVACGVSYSFRFPDEAPTDEVIVVSLLVGIGVAFAIAVVNRLFKFGLLSQMAEKTTFVLIPPLALIFLVLGTIFVGVATPTEGGAMGALGALIMALARKRLNLSLLKQAMNSTAKLTTFVVFILVGARVFSLTFYGVDGHKWVEELLLDLPGGQLGFLIVVNLLVFLLAFFLDFFELAFIVVPLLGPVAEKLGIDLIFFGILLGINMQTSFMHPPFGFALFYLRSVAPTKAYVDKVSGKLTEPITTAQIYWGAVPYVVIQMCMVGILIAFPQLVTFGLGKQEKVDIDKVQIIVPMDEASPAGSVATPGSAPAEEEDPAKAIERALKQETKAVAAATGGKFQIQVFAGGEIVPGLQVLDAVQAGTVECCHTAVYYFVGKDPTFAFECAMPFGLNYRQQTAWFEEGGGRQLMNEFYRDYNCLGITCGNTGAQMGGWFRKEIKGVEDLKGLKMRIGGYAGQVLSRLGLVPQQIAGGDIYPALEKGTIDAAEWIGPYDDEKLGFNKVAKYYYYPGWWEGGPQLSLLVGLKAWESLPKEYQAILHAACMEAHVKMMAKYDAQNPPALKRLIGSGTQLRPFPKPVMEACYKAAFELYAETAAKNAKFKKVFDSWVKFRQDQIQWFRVAENTFDDFVATAK